MIVGIWCGLKLYGKLDDAAFRRVILMLLLAAGVSLVAPAMARWVRTGSIAANLAASKIVDHGTVAAGRRTA